MTDEADKRGQLIRHLEDALALADEIEDGEIGFLIERALDEARSRQFRLTGRAAIYESWSYFETVSVFGASGDL